MVVGRTQKRLTGRPGRRPERGHTPGAGAWGPARWGARRGPRWPYAIHAATRSLPDRRPGRSRPGRSRPGTGPDATRTRPEAAGPMTATTTDHAPPLAPRPPAWASRACPPTPYASAARRGPTPGRKVRRGAGGSPSRTAFGDHKGSPAASMIEWATPRSARHQPCPRSARRDGAALCAISASAGRVAVVLWCSRSTGCHQKRREHPLMVAGTSPW